MLFDEVLQPHMYFISTTEIELLSTRYIYFFHIHIYIYIPLHVFFSKHPGCPKLTKWRSFLFPTESSRLSNPSCRTVRKSNALMNYEYGQGISVLVLPAAARKLQPPFWSQKWHTQIKEVFFQRKLACWVYIWMSFFGKGLTNECVLKAFAVRVRLDFFGVCIGSKKSGRLCDTLLRSNARPKKRAK